MNIVSIAARTTAVALILAIVPASSVFAQARKAKHSGGVAQRAAPAQHVARPMTPAKSATSPPPKGVVPSPESHQPEKTDDELVASLHSTKSHLDLIGQDERGHHARAMSEVNNAIKLLGPTSSSPAKPSTAPARPANTPAITERHLTEAQKMLQEVESQMSVNGINAHQYIRARISIQTALRELNLALVDR